MEVLCSSLTDTERFKQEEFKNLYHYRWNEEEAYKLLKSRIELEDFSGKTATAVKQDFYAKAFLMTLCAAYAHPIEEKVRKEYQESKKRKHKQKINKTHALATLVDMIVPIFAHKKIKEAIVAFDDLVEKTREVERKGRSEPRNKKQKKPYAQAYKRL